MIGICLINSGLVPKQTKYIFTYYKELNLFYLNKLFSRDFFNCLKIVALKKQNIYTKDNKLTKTIPVFNILKIILVVPLKFSKTKKLETEVT